MSETWSVLRLLEWTAGYFVAQGIESARLDAELLLGDVLKLNRVGLYLHFDRPLTAGELATFRALVKRRAAREPLAYIRGHCEFWSLSLKVSPAVLIPRADTEVLVEEALARLPVSGRVLDIGTGSGAIAIAIAHERPQAEVAAIDVSPSALAMASSNAEHNGVRVAFATGDLDQLSGGPYDLLVSNPPYIAETVRSSLMPEVEAHEPGLALFSGADGLAAIRRIAAQAPTLLATGGWLLLEVGYDQSTVVRELLATAGLTDLFVRDDYAGIPRVVGGRKP
jgi:release factor glutamine methyltransferase